MKTNLVCSFPKCGRTWVRFILANYINQYVKVHKSIDFFSVFTLCPNYNLDPERGLPAYALSQQDPFVTFSHAVSHSKEADKLLIIKRCPLDTLVSYYFQLSSRHGRDLPPLSEFTVNQSIFTLIEFYNELAATLANNDPKQLKTISYESLHGNTMEVMSSVIEFFELSLEVDKLTQAIAHSAFDSLRRLEIEKGFPNRQIVIDPTNPNSLRAREGKVNGHTQHFSKQQIYKIKNILESRLTLPAKILLSEYF